MRFGVQLFGAAKECQKNPEAFFEKVLQMGYEQLEPCIVLGQGNAVKEYGIWDVKEAERLLPAMKRSGLKLLSAHAFVEDVRKALPEMKRLSVEYGIQQWVFPCPKPVEKENYRQFAAVCTAAAKELSQIGVELLLHNEPEEIAVKIEGKSAYEWLLDACKGQVGAQPNLGWLLCGGENPESFLWRNVGRIRSVHYKDMKEAIRKVGEKQEEIAPGLGILDMEACFQFARAQGIPQIVDMDGCGEEFYETLAGTARRLSGLTQFRGNTESVLCTLDVETGVVKKLHHYDSIIEAPNWLLDGTLFFNSEGRIYRYYPESDKTELVPTGECTSCNNDHVVSPDNRYLAISNNFVPEVGDFGTHIHIVDLIKGTERRVSDYTPCFLHGWSPDGKELAYCAFRGQGKDMCVDVYTIPVEWNTDSNLQGGVETITTGQERRLTQGNGYNDGPEYSPDGKHIWYVSTCSGLMQLWRMNRDGSGKTQMSHSEANNWFGHVSPDGKKVVYLSYRKDDLEPNEHLPNMQVSLRMMNYDGSGDRELLQFFGGQGSINVNSWSSDSKQIAFVQYILTRHALGCTP